MNLFSDTLDVMPVPPDLQIPLILKILTYDRNFDVRAQSELRISIVYSQADPASVKAGNQVAEVLQGFSDKTVKNVPIRSSRVEYTTDTAFESFTKSSRVNVLYIAPGNAKNLQRIIEISKARQIITTTGVPEYVDQGVTVGVGVRQDKPQILINLASSKSVGSEFDASLLRIAKVVR